MGVRLLRRKVRRLERKVESARRKNQRLKEGRRAKEARA